MRPYSEHEIYEGILTALDAVASRIADRGILDQKLLRVGRCRKGNRFIPCLKERCEWVIFGRFVIYRKDRTLILVDNLLHSDRKLRIISFDRLVTGIALEEFGRLADRIGAKSEYREILPLAGA